MCARSAEDRAQTLLALLSRHHVLGEAVTGEAGGEDGHHAAAVAAVVKDETTQVQIETQETDNHQQANEAGLTENIEKSEGTGEDQGKDAFRSLREGDAAAGLDAGDGNDDGDDRYAERGGKRREGGKAAMRLRFSARGRKECEEAFMELMLDERNR